MKRLFAVLFLAAMLGGCEPRLAFSPEAQGRADARRAIAECQELAAALIEVFKPHNPDADAAVRAREAVQVTAAECIGERMGQRGGQR
jgi:hypothetical protein